MPKDHSKPRKRLNRTDYHVAWIAPASGVETLPARLMLDEEHDPPDYDVALDENAYIFGEILNHNVVIPVFAASLTGNVNACVVAGSLSSTFPSVNMVLIVGIGGGIPRAVTPPQAIDDIHVGDVVVGWPADGSPHCIYPESGRRHVANFEILGTFNRPNRILLNALAKLRSDYQLNHSEFYTHQQRLLQSRHESLFRYPGRQKDRLFQANYCHEGEYNDKCASCNDSRLVMRPVRSKEEADRIVFHQGTIATGNSVIMDGIARDKIRDQCHGALCVEMEAAGIDATQPCLVIRGISDYADSHKGDDWRSYAAGNAAVFARALLSKVVARKPGIPTTRETHSIPFYVPFDRNKNFVGRTQEMEKLLGIVPPVKQAHACQRTVISGLGGIGKTQIVIELAYRAREDDPNLAIYWIPAVDIVMFEGACREIGELLKTDPALSVKDQLKISLSGNQEYRWLLILDNLDDLRLLRDSEIWDRLPSSKDGSIVVTTRNSEVAFELEANEHMQLHELDPSDGEKLLHSGLRQHQIGSPEDTRKLLGFLMYLPLAIKQASAFLLRKPLLVIGDYLRNLQHEDEGAIKMLSTGFNDLGRYNSSRNPVATTWLVSFTELVSREPLAVECLQNIAFFAETDVPLDLLPGKEGDQARRLAVGVLWSYGFVHFEADSRTCRAHRLVSLVMRNWLKDKDETIPQINRIMRRLVDEYSWSTFSSDWTKFVSHIWSINALVARRLLKDRTRGDIPNQVAQQSWQAEYVHDEGFDEAYWTKLTDIWLRIRRRSPSPSDPGRSQRKRIVPTLITAAESSRTAARPRGPPKRSAPSLITDDGTKSFCKKRKPLGL